MTYIPDSWTERNDGTGTGLDADLLDGVEAAAFLQDITGEALETLSDVTITGIASGEILKWNGSIWINQTLAEAGIQPAGSYLTDITGEPLSDLSDVTITTIASGEMLQWNGSIWINQTFAELGVLTDITGEALSTLSDVTITGIAAGELLKWNGSIWINQTLAEAGISATGHSHVATDVTDFSAAADARIALATISDLALTTISAIADGELLRWNGSIWVNNTLAEAGIQAAGSVADMTITAKTGAYTLVLTDDVVTGDSSGGTFTLTLPTAVGNDGKLYHIKKIDSSANVVTIDGDGIEEIDGTTTVTLDVEWHSLTIVSDGAGWLII